MRKILALLVLGCAALAHAQVIGLNPTPIALYYWNTGTNQWAQCPNSSTAQAAANIPQAFALEGFNSGLMQWTPQTSCPGSGSGSGLTSFQGRTTPAAVLILSDLNTMLKTATNCNVSGGYSYSPYSNSCILSGSSFTAAGDLSGTSSSQTVIGIRGKAVVSTAPTDGQVLQWSTGLNEYVPATISGSSYTPPVTTKGDLFGFSTVPARIPVGADTYVLTADSTQALGVKWAAASGSGDTITSPGSTISVGGTPTNTTLDVNLAHANTWTGAQAFTAGVLDTQTQANCPLYGGLGGCSYTSLASNGWTYATPTSLTSHLHKFFSWGSQQ